VLHLPSGSPGVPPHSTTVYMNPLSSFIAFLKQKVSLCCITRSSAHFELVTMDHSQRMNQEFRPGAVKLKGSVYGRGRFEGLTAMTINLWWRVAWYRFINFVFRGDCYLYLENRFCRFSETLAKFYHIVCHHVPADSIRLSLCQ
jgi:hypothetical protein